MSKISYGIGKLKEGYRYGTMQECLDAGQVRLYGKYKIDSRLLEAHETAKKERAKKTRANPKGKSNINNKLIKRDDLMIRIAGIRGRMNKLKKQIEAEKNAKNKKALQKDLISIKTELEQAMKLYNSKFD